MGYNTHPVNPSFRVARNFSACSKREGKRFSNFPSSRSKFFSPLGSKKTKRCTIAYKRAALFFFFFISLISCAARRETVWRFEVDCGGKKAHYEATEPRDSLGNVWKRWSKRERERRYRARRYLYSSSPYFFFQKSNAFFTREAINVKVAGINAGNTEERDQKRDTFVEAN